jgi:hypothetical protein
VDEKHQEENFYLRWKSHHLLQVSQVLSSSI